MNVAPAPVISAATRSAGGAAVPGSGAAPSATGGVAALSVPGLQAVTANAMATVRMARRVGVRFMSDSRAGERRRPVAP
jgi:hypothetical protein